MNFEVEISYKANLDIRHIYILRVIHHSQNITTNFFLADNEIPYVVESD